MIIATDMFCGAGGTSTGLLQAAEELGEKIDLTAINHDDIAIETHSQNHPEAKHLQMNVDSAEARTTGKSSDIIVASPECTNHSHAKGDKPKDDQSRASAWHVVSWAAAHNPLGIIVENVKEFIEWGPLNKKGKPIPSKKGQVFRAWLTALRSLGYRVQWQIINCANYGDATTRKRFFLIATKGKCAFPNITHSKDPDLFNLKPWVPAKNIIDFSLKGNSIFERDIPLVPNTMRRITHGLEKFCKEELRPYLIMMYGNSNAVSLDSPLPTITTNFKHYLCEPYLTVYRGTGNVRSLDLPLPALTAQGKHLALCEPFLVRYNKTGNVVSLDNPLPTITTKDRFGLVQTVGLDILYRMLQAHELAAAMSFPENYKFAGNNSDIIRQIGNAVPVKTAKALCKELLLNVISMKRLAA